MNMNRKHTINEFMWVRVYFCTFLSKSWQDNIEILLTKWEIIQDESFHYLFFKSIESSQKLTIGGYK